jgi:predicted RNA binding protein YcfA (HicA-like mRNA interferase family)
MKLPTVSGKEIIKFFGKLGFETIRQRGSHISLCKASETGKILVVVVNKPEIKKRTLLNIIQQARLTREEFIELWEKS